MTLGDIISDYRASHSMTMDTFSKLSGISKAYISILERNRTPRGDEPSPTFEMYKAVAKTVGVDVDELIRKVEGKIDLAPTPENLTSEESALLAEFRSLSDEKQSLLLKLLETMQ